MYYRYMPTCCKLVYVSILKLLDKKIFPNLKNVNFDRITFLGAVVMKSLTYVRSTASRTYDLTTINMT